MDFQKNQIVRAIAGRDKPNYFVITEVKDGFAYLADGKRRRLENPKKKNLCHLQKTKTLVEETLENNRQLRRILSEFCKGGEFKEE